MDVAGTGSASGLGTTVKGQGELAQQIGAPGRSRAEDERLQAGDSTIKVTGPSLWISTCMYAPKTPRWGGNPCSASRVEKALVQTLGDSGWGGLDEAGATALAAVAVQGKLRDGEYAAADVEHRAIHLAIVIGEDAQVSALFRAEAQCSPRRRRDRNRRVGLALVNLAAELAIDVDASVADALDEDFHGRGTVIGVKGWCAKWDIPTGSPSELSDEFQMYPSLPPCQPL